MATLNGSDSAKQVFRLCFSIFSIHAINIAASTCFKQPRLAILGVAGATPGNPRRREARPKLEHASNSWIFAIKNIEQMPSPSKVLKAAIGSLPTYLILGMTSHVCTMYIMAATSQNKKSR